MYGNIVENGCVENNCVELDCDNNCCNKGSIDEYVLENKG